ncbi:MAG: GDP-mannose 4,6-dehydratase [Acidobacteria bacterium]|jgi:UDP-glucose 4-epimerase|nr:nucleoside-diphosphate sugar epimerase [Acidobacteriota bacterium]MCS5703262.1 GDP-mannose 4,6-dehydratase [Acidobacteriota bacterium]MED5559223.1 GDP-mannose 4,6-dehydratase [Acidobacteriota bacterium]|tara:strand:+ start:2184 stop:3167 length:984 start_codon:yes stop_codon:yes gene_type:complete
MVDGNQTFFLTGGAGFIGSHLTEAILAGGDRVLSIDNLSTGSMDNVTHFLGHPNHRFEQASITDRGVMERMASEADVIVHLAAAVGVKLIVEHPVQTIETNVMGTEEILRVALRNKCRVLIASTSEVYGKGSKFPFAEEDDVLLGATSKSRWAYAASKMVDEFLGLAYWREFGLDVVPFRLFNTIGPRQTGQYGMVVPRFIRQALGGEPITVYGDGSQRRCFCDVRDVVPAILGLAGHSDAPGRVYNIGGTEEVSIQELAERVVEMTGSDSQITKVPYSEAYAPGFEDMERRVPDTERIHELLGWKPKRGLREILSDVISYERGRTP